MSKTLQEYIGEIVNLNDQMQVIGMTKAQKYNYELRRQIERAQKTGGMPDFMNGFTKGTF